MGGKKVHIELGWVKMERGGLLDEIRHGDVKHPVQAKKKNLILHWKITARKQPQKDRDKKKRNKEKHKNCLW